jgi:predicted phage terminase large subunit-like protein
MKVEIPDLLGLAREDLACYSVGQWPPFELAAHHRLVVDRLEAVERGEIRRLIVCMPPRHGKSLLATQMFPTWFLGRHPDRFIISASYAQELADDFGRKVRNLVGEPLHRALFPGCRLADDSTSMRRFNTTAGGSYYAVGRGGSITGRGADLLLIDDPLKGRDEAQSEIIRRGLKEWYASVAYTRLQPGAAIVLIQTRWHEDDLAGWLLREQADEHWDLVSLPAIAEADDGFRREGKALWPQKFPLEALEQIRQAIGSAAWASLYQQRPAAAEGAIFKRGWWQYFTTIPTSGRIVQSWDSAFKAKSSNDFSVCTTWISNQQGNYLVSLWKDRVEFPELKKQVAAQAAAWRPHAILIEDCASGQSLIQELRTTSLPILPVKADSDKVSRASAVTAIIEAGRVFLLQEAGWLTDFVDETASFPNGAHDDQVDSLTQALNYLRQYSQSCGTIAAFGRPIFRPFEIDGPRSYDTDGSTRSGGFRGFTAGLMTKIF